MLYKLLIVDDEEIIRISLSTFIKWKDLGFEVVQCLADGREAMAYLAAHPVDVVLTDIKMTFVSGLELAGHIRTHFPQTKVVLISGFRDFEYAKQAIAHQVTHYLLKPTRVDEVKRVFTQLNEQIGEERAAQAAALARTEQFSEVIPYLQEQFFTDVLTGRLRNAGDVDEHMEKLHIDPGLRKAQYWIAQMTHAHSAALADIPLCSASMRLMAYDCPDMLFHIIPFGRLRLLVLCADVKADPEFERVAQRQMLRMIEALEASFGISARMISAKRCGDVYALARECLESIRQEAQPEDGTDAGTSAREGETSEETIDLALSYLESHFSSELSLEDVARFVHLSPAYFSRYFRQKTGQRFIDHLVSLRMAEAMRLLRETNLRVHQIAQRVGYGSVRYFTDQFKKHCGVLPLVYRAEKAKKGES